MKQRVIATLGRLDELRDDGKLEALFRFGLRFCEKALLVSVHEQGEAPVVNARRLGAVKVLERLWQETGCQAVVLDENGRPICCELWPANTTDVKALLPVAQRLSRRFAIQRVCLVSDREAIVASLRDQQESNKTIMALQSETPIRVR